MPRTQRPVTRRKPASAFAKLSQWLPAWNAQVAAYERRVKVLCWAPPQDKRIPLGELIAVDLGLGAPPHDGLRPLDRLLAMAIRGAFDAARPDDPEVGGVLDVGQTRDRERLDVTFEAWAKRTGCSDPQRAASIVGLVALTRLRERDGPYPAPGAWSAGPRLHLERLVRERLVPDAASEFVAAALEDRISEQDLIREGRALLAAASSAAHSTHKVEEEDTGPRYELDLDEEGQRHLLLNARRLSYAGPSGARGGKLTVQHKAVRFFVALALGKEPAPPPATALSDLRRALREATKGVLSIRKDGDRYRLNYGVRVSPRLAEHMGLRSRRSVR